MTYSFCQKCLKQNLTLVIIKLFIDTEHVYFSKSAQTPSDFMTAKANLNT